VATQALILTNPRNPQNASLPPAGALHLSSLLYKSASFSQNKANVKMGKMTISLATIKAYANEQRAMSNEHYPKQTQSNPISNDQSQIKANFKRSSVVREIAPYS